MMHTEQIVEFLSLPAPRHVPAELRRRIRESVLPSVLLYVFAGLTLLSIAVSVLVLYLMLVQFRLWHDLVLDFGRPATAQGKVVSIRYIPATRKSFDDMLVGFIFRAGDKREFTGICSRHQDRLDKGDPVRIEYLETNPAISRITGGTIRPRSVTYGAIVMPLLILPFSLLPFLLLYLRSRNILKLFASGTLVSAAVQNVAPGSRGYHRATLAYTHSAATYRAHEFVRKQVAAVLQNKMSASAPVTLVIDPAHPKKYFLLERMPSG